MEITRPAGDRPSTLGRAGRAFVTQLRGRSTLLIVLSVALILGVALAVIRNGVTLGDVTGRESTDDAYVRADQIAIAAHIAGYLQSVPVRDNQNVRRGQLVATIEDDDYRAKVASAQAALQASQSAVEVLSRQAELQTLCTDDLQHLCRRTQVGYLLVTRGSQALLVRFGGFQLAV